jgi:CDP-paratose 2-epimerase
VTGGTDTRPILITGGAGFIGSNLADRLASDGEQVLVLDSLARPGVQRNLDWLQRSHGARIVPVVADVRDENEVVRAAREAKAVFHFAAQVAVTTSMVDPREDFEINVRGTINLLDAVRQRREAVPVIFASTNKVYGDLIDVPLERRHNRYQPVGELADTGVDERRPLDFHTPYGCSKGAADQYVLDYARSFGVPTAVFRMSCIYGQRQMGTEDQGWVAHFLIRALAGEPVTIYGDGRQVRDILDVGDAVAAYIAAWRNIDRVAGQAMNLGGGPANAVSLVEIVEAIRDLTGRDVDLRFEDWRPGDQRWYVSDPSRARTSLGLGEPLAWRMGLARLASWLERDGATVVRPVPSYASAAE